MAKTTTRNLGRWAARVRRLSPAAKALMKKANQANADDFTALVKRNIPRGDPADGNLVDTLAETEGATETAVRVSIGSADHPYPLHLEVGHRTQDGEHVPGKRYWYPARRVLRKRAKGRSARALTAAVKSIVSGGD